MFDIYDLGAIIGTALLFLGAFLIGKIKYNNDKIKNKK